MPKNLTRLPIFLFTAVLAAGCGSAPEQIEPGGIDELVIPTPEVDTGDFSQPMENQWFPLEPGTVAEYSYQGETLATRAEITVLDEGRTIAEVDTVAVRKVVFAKSEVLTQTLSWYAEDNSGNVWLFGERFSARVNGRDSVQSDWAAGEKGAEAGLVMPADPRVGDGFAAGFSDGTFTGRAEVLDTDQSVRVAYGDYEGVVILSVERPTLPDISEQQYYAREIGLVRVEQSGAANAQMGLTGHRN